MNSFEINKILGALLGTCLFLLAVHIASGALFSPVAPAKPGYEIAVKAEQPQSPGGAAPASSANEPIENLLASASIEHGTTIAKECQLCHNFGKGQGNKVGPDLYGVVGRPVASEAGFNYSPPLKAKGGTWTFDALNTWLTDPRADVPGTLMTFAGLPNEKQRADVIAYLNSNSDKALPLPAAAQNKAGATADQGAAAKNSPANAASPPANAASPPANAASPPANAASPPANAASPPANAASPPASAAVNPPAAAPATPSNAAANPPAANAPGSAPANPPVSAPANVPNNNNAAATPPASSPGNAPSNAPANPPAAAPANPPAASTNPPAAAPANAPANAPSNAAASPPPAPASASTSTKAATKRGHAPAKPAANTKRGNRKPRRPPPRYE
jgi:cytochrome c